jgi:hypothetical protein
MERAQLIADTSAALLSAHISRQPPPGLRSAPLTPLASPHAPTSPMAGPFTGHPSSLGSSGEYPYAGSLAAPYFSCELPPNFAAGGPVSMPNVATSGVGITNVAGVADPLYALASKGAKVPPPPPPSTGLPLAGISVPPPPPAPPVGGLRLAFMQQQILPTGGGVSAHLLPQISAPPPGAGSSISPSLDGAGGLLGAAGGEGAAGGAGLQPDLATLHVMSTIATSSVVSGAPDVPQVWPSVGLVPSYALVVLAASSEPACFDEIMPAGWTHV